MIALTIYPLYIDPGTGSMLFSVLLGLLASIYFVGRALIIKFKFALTGKKSDVASDSQKYVIFCEGTQYINVFLPVLEAFEKRKTPLLYWTSVQDDPAFTANYSYITTEYIGEGNTAIARLNFLKATICLMTTPGLDVYQLKRSKGVKHYAHVLHMARDATSYRLFGLDYFDSILLSGDYQKKDIRLLEKIRNIPTKELVTVGCPYLDVSQRHFTTTKTDQAENASSKKESFTVLVSPSWGKSGLLTRYGTTLLDPLVKTGFHIIIRPHPQSKQSEASILEKLKQAYATDKNVEWDYESDNTTSMTRSNIMISDFSGIILDYAFLQGKPFLYTDDFDLRPYDSYDLAQLTPPVLPWQFGVLPTIGKKLEEKYFQSIGDVLNSLSTSKDLEEGRKLAKQTAWMHEGKSGEKIADFMIEKATTLENAE